MQSQQAMRIAIVFLCMLLLFPAAYATSHYSYEHAEELKPLIEWRDYSPAAFSEAVEQNKPLFLLLTAPSWCYWCQVYESEEFLFHPSVIKVLNEQFIPVYVDADQRQDLTRQYLEGGWPSTTILSPGRERLFGFSGPRPPGNMVANLEQSAAFVKTQGYANRQAYDYTKEDLVLPTQQQLTSLVNNYAGHILASYDSEFGGFGTGQKFPQGRALDFSLELYELTGEQRWLDLVKNTLQNQYTELDEIETNYNIFDPVEGGFHRYGTRRDWTPPHYEKMLYDNARLLKAYYHLQTIDAFDDLAFEVVDKTLRYIYGNWYDKELGGFAGNTDVHGEDEYYGKNPRPAEKPRVEHTKYSDWNADAILTYLYIYGLIQDSISKDIVTRSLDFYAEEMVTDQGAYHYRKPDGEKGVRGSLLDNSYLTLAFIEGYEVLKDDTYLAAARTLADYSLDKLYDWHSGGFFERNSPDIDLYALGDHINLGKPSQENGIITFALLKLYKSTDEPLYLTAALRTLGANIGRTGTLDRGYYYVKAAQYATRHNLLQEFEQRRPALENLEKERQDSFWLNKLITDISPAERPVFQATTEGLETLQGPILFLLVIALFAGFISFISPCTLPILPAYFAYMFRSSKKNIKGMTIAFFIGLSLLFTLLGMSATFVGSFLKDNLTVFSQVAGIALILIGFYIISGRGFGGFKIKKKQPTSYVGSFLFGGVFGLSWTPCVGPILVAILLLASTTGSVATGGILLFAYAVGLAVPLFLISAYLGRINTEGKVWKFIRGKELWVKIGGKKFTVHSTSLLSGLLFIVLGYLIFSGILFTFNQYVAATGFQKLIFKLEDWVLGLVN